MLKFDLSVVIYLSVDLKKKIWYNCLRGCY